MARLIPDREVEHGIRNRSSRLVAWWLMGSYLYYIHDVGLMSDAMFDHLSEFLSRNPDVVAGHPHGALVNTERLLAGTGFDIRAEDYPAICRDAAVLLNNQLKLGPRIPWPDRTI